MWLNLPNVITLTRLGLIPVFILFFYLPWGWANLIAVVVFTLAAATDWLDGYLARRLNQVSDFGRFLDPVADKLAVAVALILLVQRHPHVWMALPVIVIISREITISALREWMAEIGERAQVAVSLLGKIKTTVQMLAIMLVLYQMPVYGVSTLLIGMLLLYAAVALTVWSMAIYLRAAWPLLRGEQGEIPE
ncbi:MAG: CDP-diacylglycerol--glycerol-3-phosphate 3-phosphatidyltransferase [Gammaproteobacteria bacterium]|nr:CDP-diacylglycerol--glycerol-3-phosphate 3-phosphatidyltransferase [Gammaproteobacteria bacterium]